MDLSKRDMLFLGKALLASVLLPVALVAIWSLCVDWRGPIDDLDSKERALLEGCIMAERSLGDSIYEGRPDCRFVLEPMRIMASKPVPRDCELRFNEKQGGDDGLDTCGYPGFSKCLDALPPGCP